MFNHSEKNKYFYGLQDNNGNYLPPEKPLTKEEDERFHWWSKNGINPNSSHHKICEKCGRYYDNQISGAFGKTNKYPHLNFNYSYTRVIEWDLVNRYFEIIVNCPCGHKPNFLDFRTVAR
ncbi:MAG TPA: hypothetical protein VEA37_13570 [Flavobacterium sp.]|nr:hypothetical protein [Flavobacterium sp.]